jgi:DNA polymerase-3 subunit epsilon/ATP-dependent DNA helicase DinG
MYLDTLSSSILEISKSTQEKILILFTSYSSLNKVRKDLKEKLTSLGKELICQGVDGSANRVIKKFKGKNTILFGTGPLWQGVDFNDDLGIKILYITKLPFAVPTDPLFAARASKYSDSFHEFVLPDAIRRFKQGIGRLLRSNKDYGAIIVSDSRIINKNYGEEFLNAIPGYSYMQSDSESISENISEWLASRD